VTSRVAAARAAPGVPFGPAAGLIGAAGFLAATTVAVVTYAGRAGEAFSPLAYWVSELGELGVSSSATIFNLGLIVGALGFAGFMTGFARERGGRVAMLAGLAGFVGGIFGALVGVFPLGSGGPHRIAAIAFFLLGFVAIALASADLWRRPSVAFPRWLAVLGALVALAYLGFIVATLTFDRVDYAAVARPAFLIEPAVEWVAIGGTLVWTLLASLSWLRAARGPASE
jgi:hypothetical membrane protein